MPKFIYTATDKHGKLVEGKMEANNEKFLIAKLRGSNLFPVSIKPENMDEGLKLNFSFKSAFGRVNNAQILDFTKQLSTLLNSGLSLDRSLTIMVELCEKETFRNVIDNVQKSVHSGSSFADSISRYPGIFSKLYVNMIKAGEEGGVLEIILQRLAGFLESSERLRENVKSAMVYPMLLVMVGGSAVAILLTFVIPKFAKIFSDMGQAIPLPTKILLNFSAFVSGYWWVILILCLLLFLAFKAYAATAGGKFFIDKLKLALPLSGDIETKIQVARFSRTLGTLINSGVSLLKAISITGDTLTNSVIDRSLIVINRKVKEGSGISTPLKESGVFPSLAIHMIRVGEETGRLEEMLMKVSDTYDKDVENSVKKFISLLEPLMILVMGLIVGFIVISMLMAVFSMNELPV